MAHGTQEQTDRMCFACYTTRPAEEFSRSRPNSCVECVRAAARRYYQENDEVRERYRLASARRYHARRDEARELNRRYQAEIKAKAIAIYGGSCARCGGTDRLEFDHVLNDGAAHRERENNQTMLRRIARLGTRLSDVELQLLCHTHHWEKTLAERRAKRASRT